ncbi:MAG: ABC transporter ATP-binding protein [Kiritimatiellae bacterium]|nr:ABC transporter ATP-binding protein [Kiritimatiellia bacterium]
MNETTGQNATEGAVRVRSLFRYLKRYWFWLALAPAAMLLETAMDLMQPALMTDIVDVGVRELRPEVVRATGWRMLLCAALGALGGMACTFVSSRAATGFGNDLRKALFARVQRLSFAQTDRFTAGSLTTRLTNDVMTMQFVVVMLTRMLLRSPFLLVGSVVLVLRTDWRLALPLVLSAPPLAWIVVHWMRRMMPLFAAGQKRTDELSSAMQEALEGIRVVKAFAAEDRVRGSFGARNEALADTGLQSGMLGATLGPALQFVQQVALVAIVFLAAREADAGLVKVGQIAAIVNWSTQVMMSLVMLSFQSMHFSRAMISARRLAEVVCTEPEIRDGPRADPPADASVELRGVSFSYPGASGDPVLRGVDLRVEPGEHVAIVGGTGSGKTTLLSLLPRFYDVTGGAALVGGRDVRDYRLDALRGAMGIVMQNPRLFSGTVAENVRWGRADASDEEVLRVLRIAQADRFVAGFPAGLATDIAQGGTTLSGGQRQRLAIARALLRRPRILLLDDATSAVDPATERALRAALRAEAAGTTVLTVAQRVDSIRDADRIVVLDGGAVAGVGTHDELLASCPTYREIVDSQSTDPREDSLTEAGKEAR